MASKNAFGANSIKCLAFLSFTALPLLSEDLGHVQQKGAVQTNVELQKPSKKDKMHSQENTPRMVAK